MDDCKYLLQISRWNKKIEFMELKGKKGDPHISDVYSFSSFIYTVFKDPFIAYLLN